MGRNITVDGAMRPENATLLTPEALALVERLHRAFRLRHEQRLAARCERQAAIGAGSSLAFLDETAGVRGDAWSLVPASADLNDRRVEITGPVKRKMIINALNSGARLFMANSEDPSRQPGTT